jgi:hypothetical protein
MFLKVNEFFFINLLWLQIDELNAMAKDSERTPLKIPNGKLDNKDLLCQHKEDPQRQHFALGLCEDCYKDVSNFFVMHYLWLLLTTYFYHLLSY